MRHPQLRVHRRSGSVYVKASYIHDKFDEINNILAIVFDE
jgi:hypothetical protein